MKIISFAWTTSALLARRKSVTRRHWKERFALGFKEGEEVWAYNKQPRNHGHAVAVLRLTRAPYRELYSDMPDDDYEAEGFKFFEEHPEQLPSDAPWPEMTWDTFVGLRRSPALVWVVRFDLVHTI